MLQCSWSLPGWPSPKAPKLVLIDPTASTKNNKVCSQTPIRFLLRPSPSPSFAPRARLKPLSTPLPRPPPDFERRTPPTVDFFCLSPPPSLLSPPFLQKAFPFHPSPASHSRVIRADGSIASIGGLFHQTCHRLSSSIDSSPTGTFGSFPFPQFFVVSFWWFLQVLLAWLGCGERRRLVR